jgi:hypothetical protein
MLLVGKGSASGAIYNVKKSKLSEHLLQYKFPVNILSTQFINCPLHLSKSSWIHPHDLPNMTI